MSMADAIIQSYKTWERKPADLYPTPVDATESIIPLLQAISLRSDGTVDPYGGDGRSIQRVWEPACGDGRLSRVLEWHGYEVTSTDLRECIPHPGVGGIDFLKPSVEACFNYDAIITNPPFSHARQFVERARSLAPIVIMLVKQNYWNTKGRLSMWDEHRPTFFLPITWRLAFLKQERGNSPLMDCAWCVWIEGMEDECFFEPVRKLVYPGYHDIGVLGAMANLAEAMADLVGAFDDRRSL
jgi:hypothetical protein